MLLRLAGDSVDLGAQAVAIVRQDKLLWVATMDKMISCYTGPSPSLISYCIPSFLHWCLSFHYLSLSVSLFLSLPVFFSLSLSISVYLFLSLSLYLHLSYSPSFTLHYFSPSEVSRASNTLIFHFIIMFSFNFILIIILYFYIRNNYVISVFLCYSQWEERKWKRLSSLTK